MLYFAILCTGSAMIVIVIVIVIGTVTVHTAASGRHSGMYFYEFVQ